MTHDDDARVADCWRAIVGQDVAEHPRTPARWDARIVREPTQAASAQMPAVKAVTPMSADPAAQVNFQARLPSWTNGQGHWLRSILPTV